MLCATVKQRQLGLLEFSEDFSRVCDVGWGCRLSEGGEADHKSPAVSRTEERDLAC